MAQTQVAPAHLYRVGPAGLRTLLDHARGEAEAGETLPGISPGLPGPSAQGRGSDSGVRRTVSGHAPFWPPAAAIRITASSTAASKTKSACWIWPYSDGRAAVDVEIESAENGG